jgi:putative ABC transport system permease protein
MIALFHFTRLALNNLRRGGQRVWVALLCITFGIMALVAMTMLAKCIESAVVLTPAQLLGGDISAGRKTEDTLRPADLTQLQSLQLSGEISSYTLIAFNSSIMFHTPGDGEMHFAGSALGIEPDKYPQAGSLVIGMPASADLASSLQQVGDVIVTRDIAEEYNLQIGDHLVLSDLNVGVPLQGTLRGVAYDTPNHQGDKIYYSIATAQQLADGGPVIDTAMLNSPRAAALSATLENSGWSVVWAAGSGAGQNANVWTLGLRGAGILGLLVGGIGIANTMQVLLRRRQREIAIWKTLGYREGQLRLIFSLEAGLLGLAGAALGAGLGVAISSGLLVLFRRTSTLLYQWTFSPTPPLMGILVGTLSTVIFAYWAIVLTGGARPMALLRNEAVEVQAGTGCQSIGLVLLLALPFLALTTLVMGSLLAAIGTLIAITVGLGLLAGIFSGALWLCTRLLTTRRFPLARMALNSLRRRSFSLVFAMIALFIGVLSMSMGLAVAQKSQFPGSAPEFQSYNLNILASGSQENAVRTAIHAQQPQKTGVRYQAALESLSSASDGAPLATTDAVLIGCSEPDGYLLSGAPWGSQPDGVYVSKWANVPAGSQVKATFRDGTSRTFRVAGTYDLNHRSLNLYPPSGLLMAAQDFSKITQADTLTLFVQVPAEQLDRAASALGAALPQATVVNLVAYAARFMHSYQNTYTLPLVLAGLALLAGLLLVANSVSLAMLDRRYEIGVLKTVGYTRRQILTIFAVEYGIVGLLATLAGVLIVQGLLAGAALAAQLAVTFLLLAPASLALIGLCGVGLTLLTVLAVTWNPTRVSPVIVLNERGA